MKLDEQLRRELAGVGWPNGFREAETWDTTQPQIPKTILAAQVLANEEKRYCARLERPHGKADKK